ncbi:MAG: hypothetical protein HQL40_12475 [Alphaproteobacteria bacterium]|nr:hypothetical protein [Alphaproteobacteria bacterium]
MAGQNEYDRRIGDLYRESERDLDSGVPPQEVARRLQADEFDLAVEYRLASYIGAEARLSLRHIRDQGMRDLADLAADLAAGRIAGAAFAKRLRVLHEAMVARAAEIIPREAAETLFGGAERLPDDAGRDRSAEM